MFQKRINLKKLYEMKTTLSQTNGGNIVQTAGPHSLPIGGKKIIQNGGAINAQSGVNIVQKGGTNNAQKGGANVAQKGGANIAQKGGANNAQKGGANVAQKGVSNIAQKGGANVAKKGGANSAQKGGANSAQKVGANSAKKGGTNSAQKGRANIAQKGEANSAQKDGANSAQKGGANIAQTGGPNSAPKGGANVSQNSGGNTVVKYVPRGESTKTTPNAETKTKGREQKIISKADISEFPTERIYRVATYVYKSLFEYSQVHYSELTTRIVTWAKHIYDLGRILFPKLMTPEFGLNNFKIKPNITQEVALAQKPHNSPDDKMTIEDAKKMFAPLKELRLSFAIYKRLLEIPATERIEIDADQLAIAKNILDLTDEKIRYLNHFIEEVCKGNHPGTPIRVAASSTLITVNTSGYLPTVPANKVNEKAAAKPAISLVNTAPKPSTYSTSVSKKPATGSVGIRTIPVLVSSTATGQPPVKVSNTIPVLNRAYPETVPAPRLPTAIPSRRPLLETPFSYNQPRAPMPYRSQPVPTVRPMMNTMTHMNNYQVPFMYNQQQAEQTYQTFQPNVPPMSTMHNYQEPYKYPYPEAQYNPQYNMQPSGSAFQSSIYEPNNILGDSYAFTPTAAKKVPLLGDHPSRKITQSPIRASPNSLNAAVEKIISSITEKNKSLKSFQSRKNIEDFVNPSNPLEFSESDLPTSTKRRRLEDDHLPNLISDMEVSKENLVVGLVDHSAPYKVISSSNWNLIQKRLAEKLSDILKHDPSSFPNGLDAGWHEGRIKLFAFENERSLQLFRKTIRELGELWPGSRISVLPKNLLPHRPRYRIYVPKEPSNLEMILKIIQVSNPKMPTHDWEVIEGEGGREQNLKCICLVTNEDTFEPLLRQGMTLNYGFGSIRLKMYKKDKLPHETEALIEKYNKKKTADPLPVHERRPRSVERNELEYRYKAGGGRPKHDDLDKLAEHILKQLNHITDGNPANLVDSAAYRNWV